MEYKIHFMNCQFSSQKDQWDFLFFPKDLPSVFNISYAFLTLSFFLSVRLIIHAGNYYGFSILLRISHFSSPYLLFILFCVISVPHS